MAVVRVKGINIHPSIAKDRMVNAIRAAGMFLDQLPREMSPECTDGRNGFMHPYHIEGGVAEAVVRIILRDFETGKLAEQAQLLGSIAEELRGEHPRAAIDVSIRKQYRNMREGLDKEPRALAKAIDATRAAGLEPQVEIIRGGTDGSLMTEHGLPTPNLSSGQHNPHCPLEWTSVYEMQKSADVLVELAKAWSVERI